MGLLDFINSYGAGAEAGGCWTVFGGNTNCGAAWNTPITLTVNGVTSSYNFGDVLPGGDNPEIDDWGCGGSYTCFNLLYRCSGSISGCSCPGGKCSNFKSYKFNASACCCDLPCDGDFREATFFHDFGATISAPTSANVDFTNFTVNGTDYSSFPFDALPAPNLITIGSYTYNTAFADYINSLGIPYFTASYPTEAQLNAAISLLDPADQAGGASRAAIVRIKWPLCWDWDIVASLGGGTYTWNETSGYNGPPALSRYVATGIWFPVTTNEC